MRANGTFLFAFHITFSIPLPHEWFPFEQIESGELELSFPVWFDPYTFDTHVFPVFLGGTVLSPNRTIVSAPSMNLVYFVAVDTQRQIDK